MEVGEGTGGAAQRLKKSGSAPQAFYIPRGPLSGVRLIRSEMLSSFESPLVVYGSDK